MFLIDANVIIDVVESDSPWGTWSEFALRHAADLGRTYINPIIFAEVSAAYLTIEAVNDAFRPLELERLALPYPAAFLAAKAHSAYRANGGLRTSTMPDFFIGAHAVVSGLTVVTRDPRPYRTYFPQLELISP